MLRGSRPNIIQLNRNPCVNIQNQFGQLRFADPAFECRTQIVHLRIFRLSSQGVQMELIVYVQSACTCGTGHGLQPRTDTIEERYPLTYVLAV